jgi:glycosyltransferase involved in cell wall biosynthesis
VGRLLLLTEYYSPSLGRTSGIIEDLVESLAAAGHEVTVVCSAQRYRGGTRRQAEQIPAGVQVVRSRTTGLSRSSSLGRVLNWIAFLCCSGHQLRRRATRVDAVLSVINPIPLHWLAPTVRPRNSARFVSLIWDLLPDSAIGLGVLRQRSPLASLARMLNLRAFARVDAIVVPGSDMKQHVMQAYGVAEEKITVISNWSDVSRLYLDKDTLFPRTMRPEQPFVILGAGNMGRAQGADQLKRLASVVETEEGLLLRLVGNGPLIGILRDWVREQRLQHTKVLDFCDGADFGHLLSTASCGLVSLDACMLGLGVPSRTYTYLCAGLPVVAIVPASSEVALQLRQMGAGLVAADAVELLESVRKLRSDPQLYRRMSAAALSAAEGPLSRCRAVRQYEYVLFGQEA